MLTLSRRQAIAAMGAALAPALLPRFAQAARPEGPLVENTMHMFSSDLVKFPKHPNGTYEPRGNSLENYIAFVKKVNLTHSVIVQPEPYQDDHSYLIDCISKEPSPGYFKGTMLFDPIDPATPDRIEKLAKENPNRFTALRLHNTTEPGTPFVTSGAIKNRDFRDPVMKRTWQKLHDLGMFIQIQMHPGYAPMLRELASEFSDTPVLLDHLALHTRGTPEQYEEVIKLSQLPKVYMKISQLNENSKPLVRRIFDAYGPSRLVWGSFGSTEEAFERNLTQINEVFDYASEPDKVLIRGGNAMKLFGFTS